MLKPIENFEIREPQEIIAENGINASGRVVCHCGHLFSHSIDSNMGSHMGFIYPVCPECGCVPASKTRRIDL